MTPKLTGEKCKASTRRGSSDPTRLTSRKLGWLKRRLDPENEGEGEGAGVAAGRCITGRQLL